MPMANQLAVEVVAQSIGPGTNLDVAGTNVIISEMQALRPDLVHMSRHSAPVIPKQQAPARCVAGTPDLTRQECTGEGALLVQYVAGAQATHYDVAVGAHFLHGDRTQWTFQVWYW